MLDTYIWVYTGCHTYLQWKQGSKVYLPATWSLGRGEAAHAGWTLRRAAWCRSTFHLALYDPVSRQGWLTSEPHGPSFLLFSSAWTTSQQLRSMFLCGFVEM